MPWEEIAKFALGNGVLGVLVLVLGFTVGYLFLELRKCDRDHDTELRTIEKARLQDARETIPVLQSAANAIAAVTAEMSSRTNMAASMGEAIRVGLEAQKSIDAKIEKLLDLVRENGRRP